MHEAINMDIFFFITLILSFPSEARWFKKYSVVTCSGINSWKEAGGEPDGWGVQLSWYQWTEWLTRRGYKNHDNIIQAANCNWIVKQGHSIQSAPVEGLKYNPYNKTNLLAKVVSDVVLGTLSLSRPVDRSVLFCRIGSAVSACWDQGT